LVGTRVISSLTRTFTLAKPGFGFAFNVKLIIVLKLAATYSSSGNFDFHALSCDEKSVCEKEVMDKKENIKIVTIRFIHLVLISGLFSNGNYC
jgi:hypothetical protein